MKSIRKTGNKKISLDEISRLYKLGNYQLLAKFIIDSIEAGVIKPIKNSGINGKNPALYNRYRIIYEEEDKKKYKDELMFQLHSSLKFDYYIRNLERYKADRPYIIALSKYLSNHRDLLDESVSINERSFEIWGREKYLLREGGIRLLKNLGISIEDLNVYDTTEPLSYYSHHKNTPQNVLILENKDTFYSMRRHLLEGNKTILGLPIGTLIYGKGKGITKSFKDFTFCVEPYLNNESNQVLYFGDLDYEGILIFEQLAKISMDKNKIIIKPFIEAYLAMLTKANIDSLPKTKEKQNRNIGDNFLELFDEVNRVQILRILKQDKYIPQEILSKRDF